MVVLSDACGPALISVCVCMNLLPERPVNADQQERTLLKGVFSVRKGKTQLHKWAERQVILCGTCLIVASVKDSLTGKMHILPLVGGKVRFPTTIPKYIFSNSLWTNIMLLYYLKRTHLTPNQHVILYCTCMSLDEGQQLQV